VTEEAKQQLDADPNQFKSVSAQSQKQGKAVGADEIDPLAIMRQVQIAEQSPDSFYALAKQSDHAGAFDQTLDTRAQFECLAYYLLRLKKAVEQRDIEFIAWPDDNKAMLYYLTLLNNPKREQVQGFRWNDWGMEYQRVATAAQKILLSPFDGSATRSHFGEAEQLRRIYQYMQTSNLSLNLKKYYLFQAVNKLSGELIDGNLRDSDPEVQAMVGSLKQVYASMHREYQAMYPKPRTLAEMKAEQRRQTDERVKDAQQEYRERQERVYDMPKTGRMNTPQMIATFERVMRKQWPKHNIVKTLIKSDEWKIEDTQRGRYRIVFGYVIVKEPDGRYKAIPCSMAGKWLPGAGKYDSYQYYSLGTPFFVNYR
ncbi:MAG: hypothetical protein Q4A64_08380, partial [Porphyromonadaceae bacterium]|nr:hypothetical protein [Porphyromonadaceae bacterium]